MMIARNGEAGQCLLAVYDVGDQIHAHIVQNLARLFDLALDFIEPEAIGSIIHPIRLAMHFVKGEANGIGFLAPIRARRNCDAPHVSSRRRSGRQIRHGP